MRCSRIVTVLMALALATVSVADTLHCYYPDGTNADQGTSPCNTTAATSACCDPRDSCTTSGLCLGASGWVYRSACTDQTWKSNACPNQCQIDPNTDATYSTFAPIYACVTGRGPSQFCCGSNFNPDCCGNNFTLGNTGLAFKPGTDAVEAQLSSLSVALASATASSNQTAATASSATTTGAAPSSSSSSGHNLGTAIGAGVGIPLGVLVLGILGFIVWRERRRRPGMVDALSPGSTYVMPNRTQLTGQPPMYQVELQQGGFKEISSPTGRPLAGGGYVRELRPLEVSHELQS